MGMRYTLAEDYATQSAFWLSVAVAKPSLVIVTTALLHEPDRLSSAATCGTSLPVCFMQQCCSKSWHERSSKIYCIASSVARLIKHLIHAKLADRYGTYVPWSHISNLECHLTSTTANMLPRGCNKRFVNTALHGSGFNDQIKINRY